MDLRSEIGAVIPDVLTTDRLVLRPLAPQDAPVIVKALNNLNISRWLTVVPYPYTEDDAAWFIEENLAGRMNARLIWHSDVLVGTISAENELGYWLAEDAWGKGYATEAGRAIVDAFFEGADGAQLGSSHFDENHASRNVLLKLGFEDIGPHVHHCMALGKDMPGRTMRLTREQWQASTDG